MSERSEAWVEYLQSARRLDAVRREANTAAARETAAVAAARAELPVISARLSTQAGRLSDIALRAGFHKPDLVPNLSEQDAAAQAVAGGPNVALAALRQARSTVDVADAALARLDGSNVKPQWQRNLLVYGPLGALSLVIQIAFVALSDERSRLFYSFACGLTLSALAFGLGWLLVGLVFPKRDRTAVIGACAAIGPSVIAALLLSQIV